MSSNDRLESSPVNPLSATDNGEEDGAELADKSQESRITARRNRIQLSRLSKLKTEAEDEKVVRRAKKIRDQEQEVRKSVQQILESRKRLENAKIAGLNNISNVRVGVILRESQRRQDESRKIQGLDGKLLEERVQTQDIKVTIDQQWDKALKLNGPKQMYAHLEEQKATCHKLIEIKKKMIEELTNDLKVKDDEYVKELKRQAEEIQSVLEKMDQQYHTFQSTLTQELEQVEKVAVEERNSVLNAQITEIEKLLTSRRENELKYMHDRGDRVDDHIHQLDNLRVHDAEEYNIVKIKLETDVQVLEQQLQQMRATYQLNSEKLEYNYQVLKKREEENGTILGAQKRKINRLQDHLNIIKAKSEKQERSFQNEFNSLTDDYKRLTDLHKDLQKKVRHFQRVDHKKYREIWKMNEENAKENMRKLLQADKIIHEQQLGLKWTPPTVDVFQTLDLRKLQSTQSDTFFTRAVVNYQHNGSADDEEKTAEMLERREAFNVKIKEYAGKSSILKKMLELICNESGFLVEDKLHKLLAPLDRDEQSLMKLDSIFKALSIDSIEDIEKLTHFFIIPQDDEAKKEREDLLSTQDGIRSLTSSKFEIDTLDDSTNKLVHPNQVTKSLRLFLESQFQKDKDQEDREIIQFTRSVDVEESEKLKAEIQRNFWEKMAGVVDDNTYRMWLGVYSAMEKYNHVLQDRWNKVEEMTRLGIQNNELKNLLNQYMTSKVNDELEIPPSKILLAQAGLTNTNK